MELNRCSRCGSFYVSNGNVCPKCSIKDGVEFSNIKKNGFDDSLNAISGETGISVKNLNRFMEYDEFQSFQKNIILENDSKSNKNLE